MRKAKDKLFVLSEGVLGVGITLLLALLVCMALAGCDGNAGVADVPVAPYRGPAQIDAGSSDVVPSGTDVVAAEVPGTASDLLGDAAPGVDVLPPTIDTGAALPLDTAPALTCTKIGPWTALTAYPIAVPTTPHCFTVCPQATGSIDYAWTCVGFTTQDREIRVNGQLVECGARPLPAPVDGRWAFELSAGGHTNDFIQWSGVLLACP